MNQKFNPSKYPEFGSQKWMRYWVAKKFHDELQVSPSRKVSIRIPEYFLPVYPGMPDNKDYWHFIEIFTEMRLLMQINDFTFEVALEFDSHFKEWQGEIEAGIRASGDTADGQRAYDGKLKLIVEKESFQCSKLSLQWGNSKFGLKYFHDNSCTEIATLYVLANPQRDISIDEIMSECKKHSGNLPKILKFHNIISFCEPKSPLNQMLKLLFFKVFNERLVHFRGLEIKIKIVE
jgi:hypothetical protein